jgi:hypothetical protein
LMWNIKIRPRTRHRVDLGIGARRLGKFIQ